MKSSIIKSHKARMLLCVMLGTVSCLVEESSPFTDDGQDWGAEVNLRAEITQQYVTRANDNGFADGDQIGVFVVNYENDRPQDLALTGNHADNVRFTYDDESGLWTGAYQIYWKDKKTPVDAYGYHPFDPELSSVTAYPFSVHRNQNAQVASTDITGYEASDFLWAKAENVLPTSGLLNLKHGHVMAGVKITILEGYGFEDGEWESLSKQVMIENTRLDAQINMQTGTVSVCDDSAVESIIPIAVGIDFRAIVVPQTIEAGNNLISVTIDGQSQSYMTRFPAALTSLLKRHRPKTSVQMI